MISMAEFQEQITRCEDCARLFLSFPEQVRVCEHCGHLYTGASPHGCRREEKQGDLDDYEEGE